MVCGNPTISGEGKSIKHLQLLCISFASLHSLSSEHERSFQVIEFSLIGEMLGCVSSRFVETFCEGIMFSLISVFCSLLNVESFFSSFVFDKHIFAF